MPASDTRNETLALLERLGVDPAKLDGGTLEVRSPIDGAILARVVPNGAKSSSPDCPYVPR